MDALRAAIGVVSGLIASAASAAGAGISSVEGDGGTRSSEISDLSALVMPSGESGSGIAADEGRSPLGADVFSAAGDMSASGQVVDRRFRLWGNTGTYLRVQSLPSSTAVVSFIQQQTGIDARSLVSSERWMAGNVASQMVAVSHAWRGVSIEGAAVYGDERTAIPERMDALRLGSRSARLSFSPAENWVVRLSRGSVSGLDQIIAGDEVRRTALSATYRRAYALGNWEATLAYGRNSRRFRESATGYLAESAFHFNGGYTLFGRFEQVGSDEVSRVNEELQRQLFKMNKLTLGYSQDLRITASLRADVGAFVTRHFVPSGMAASYGDGPTAYMAFIRLRLQ